MKSKFALISVFALAFSGAALVQGAPANTFEGLDTDGNGNLNEKEIKKHKDYKDISARMATLDKDKDGYLNDNEFHGFETGGSQGVEDAGSSMSTRSRVIKPGN